MPLWDIFNTSLFVYTNSSPRRHAVIKLFMILNTLLMQYIEVYLNILYAYSTLHFAVYVDAIEIYG